MQLFCLPSSSEVPPWQEGVSCLSSEVSLEWEEGWSSGQAVEAKTKGQGVILQKQLTNNSEQFQVKSGFHPLQTSSFKTCVFFQSLHVLFMTTYWQCPTCPRGGV